jgi:hypothetical protein
VKENKRERRVTALRPTQATSSPARRSSRLCESCERGRATSSAVHLVCGTRREREAETVRNRDSPSPSCSPDTTAIRAKQGECLFARTEHAASALTASKNCINIDPVSSLHPAEVRSFRTRA